MSGHCIRLNLFLVFSLFSIACLSQTNNYYVDADQVDSAQLGTSWIYAFDDLDTALMLAEAGDTIKVASGTYKPASKRGCSTCPVSDRYNYFLIDTSIVLLGSYDPVSDSQTYSQPSVLSGDIGTIGDSTDNIHQILIILSADEVTVNGFMIEKGNGDPNITGTTINGEGVPRERGGGAFVRSTGSTTFSNCAFNFNHTGNGRGAGALYAQSPLRIEQSIFEDNSAATKGGAIELLGGSHSFDNVRFVHNETRFGGADGGALFVRGNAEVELTNCHFQNNECNHTGGAVYAEGKSMNFSNCVFIENKSADGGGLFTVGLDSLKMVDCQVTNNEATNNGGGVFNSNLGVGRYTNLVIADNSSGNFCGGLYEFNSNDVVLQNGLFVQNTAGSFGGGMICQNATVELINTTFYGNEADDTNKGDGLYNTGTSNTTIFNSIFYEHDQDVLNSTILDLSHTYVDDTLYTAADTISLNPLFWFTGDPKGADDVWGTADDGLRLSPCSPLLNMGLDSVSIDSVDLTLSNRIQLGHIDLGPYESADDASLFNGAIRFYVDSSNRFGTQDGLSWGTAFANLQDALHPCIADSTVEIWVARGTYYPDEGIGQSNNDRNAVFDLPNGVKIYGGFAGTEDHLHQRDWINNITKLSGEIQQDANHNNNSQSVFNIINCVDTVQIDGLYVQDGFLNQGFSGAAGGIISNSIVMLFNSTFSNNMAADTSSINVEEYETYFAGGLFIESGSTVAIDRCNILENKSLRGIKLTHTVVPSDPISMNYSAGGIHVSSFSHIHINHCNLSRNIDDSYAITKAIEYSNAISNSSGGLFVSNFSTAKITNCTIDSNEAKALAHAHIISVISANKEALAHSYSAGSIFIDSSSEAIINESTIAKNNSRSQSSLENDGTLLDINRRREYSSGGVLSANSVKMNNCTTSENFAWSFSPQNFLDHRSHSAGGLLAFDAELTILNQCVLSNNRALAETVVTSFSSSHSAGGILTTELDTLKIINCTISNNHSKSTSPNTPTPVSFSEAAGGLLSINNTTAVCLNSIIWQNNAVVSLNSNFTNKARPDILQRLDAGLFLQHNLLESHSLGDSTNIVGVNPNFIEPGQPATADSVGMVGNYNLSDTSIAINAGYNGYIPIDGCDLDADGDTTEYIPYDLNSNPRIQGWTVDMGAYEYDSQDTLFVDHTAVGDSTGRTWTDAAVGDFDILDFTTERDIEVVHIAQGNYLMTRNTEINSGLNMRGGFPNGGGVPNAGLHPTTLSYNFTNPSVEINAPMHTIFIKGLDLIDPSATILDFILFEGELDLEEVFIE